MYARTIQHVTVVDMGHHDPVVVVGMLPLYVADHAVEVIRRNYGDRLADPAWLEANPYPRSGHEGRSAAWLDRLAEVTDDPKVTRYGTPDAQVIVADNRRPDVAGTQEWQPHKGVIVRRSVYTDGTLHGYAMWDRVAFGPNQYSTETGFRRKMTKLAAELGEPRPEVWGPTHQEWEE